MDFANSLLQLVNNLWGLASRPLGYICNLKDNVNSLRNTTNQLKAKSETVLARVEREERGVGVERTAEVAYWLNTVQELVGRVDQILGEAGECDQIKCLSRCLPPNCWSSYKLGKRVDQLLNEARQLQHEKGEFKDLTSPLPPPPVLEMPMDETVGLDISKFNKVWKWVVDEKQVGVIGLYGTGGVGKTTLMRRIEKELLRANNGFDVVIWVVVSKPVNEDRIQDTIRRRLRIEDEEWEGWCRDERVHQLGQALTQKKFVLLIDDVWARLDLSKIGVPYPGPKNGSKVVLTTRLKHVCDHMKADQTLEVQCLMPKEALELFEKNVGKSLVDCHQDIRDLAKNIAEECKGLPLALVTVGRAMARKDSPGEWRHALTTLKNRPHKLQGMVEEVYHILEFSYNSLNDSTVKLCFLYCCLFPEDYPIKTNELIELWIGEGLLENTNDVYSMRDEGESVLGDLNRACLLESGYDGYGEPTVKMHDVIRDMATWIARDHGQGENNLLVIEKDEDMSEEKISKWGEAKQVSIWGKWIRNIDQIPSRCSQLKTLFVRETRVTVLPSGFFDSMTACLVVLNLSDNEQIESFPEGICNLINLQYLNLSATGISKLPKEIKNLTRLRWLLLDNMLSKNFFIPIGAITSLPLNVFSLWNSGYKWEHCLVKEEETVEELERMQHLTDLSIHLRKSSSAQKIFQSSKLQRRISRACIDNRNGNLTGIEITYSSAGTDGFSHLKILYLRNCTQLSEMKITQGVGGAANCSCFPNLVEVEVRECGLSDLSWLVHAPKLRELTVIGCDSMERIIGDGFAREELAASGLFSRLESLFLERLPKLTSICDQALSFPHGVSFDILYCPGLRKLPLDSSSARGSFVVEGDQGWWAEFEWDPTARVTLRWDGMGPLEEMTFGEAASKVKDESRSHTFITMRFLPRGGPSERVS